MRYEYDALNRLIREDNKKLKKTYLFEYDGNGNIVTKRQTAFTLRADVEECDFETFEYSYEGDKLISYNGELCAYNEMGSPTTYRGKTAVWKYGKLLTEFDGKTFAYDGLGRRTGKCGISFTYDSNGNLIKQSNGIEFVYDNGGVIGFKYDKQYFYRKDVQGNIIAILDSTGNIVVEYSYDAWGNCDFNGDKSLAELNPFRYRGYYYDKETKLYYLQTRYYDPETGRFISQDSVEYLDPEHINGLNLYAYCGNNPVMGIDPTGTKVELWMWTLAVMVAAASIVLAVFIMGVWPAVAATLTGAIAGGAYGAITAAQSGQDISEGFGIGLLAGITLGNIAAILSYSVIKGNISLGAAIFYNFILSAAVGIGAEALSQVSSNGRVKNWDNVVISAVQWGILNTINFGLSFEAEFCIGNAFVGGYIFNIITGVIGFIIDLIKSEKITNRRSTN